MLLHFLVLNFLSLVVNSTPTVGRLKFPPLRRPHHTGPIHSLSVDINVGAPSPSPSPPEPTSVFSITESASALGSGVPSTQTSPTIFATSQTSTSLYTSSFDENTFSTEVAGASPTGLDCGLLTVTIAIAGSLQTPQAYISF
ncbi:hypothetical protein C8J56DRAFT_13364 [Mycena floridula]|nr:hypothetical protein C8J56DRAFT_13364 [Mycena floridula]